MSNLIKVPHTIVFEAIIDLDKISPTLLPALISLNETQLIKMCKEATLDSMKIADVLSVANTGNSWAELTIKEGN